MKPVRNRRRVFLTVIGLLAAGCGNTFLPAQQVLFTTPLQVDGIEVGSAIIDTGGGFEVMLREDFGLEIVDAIEVLAFAGAETVEVTEGFNYLVGGIQSFADAAIVGVSACECNGIGFEFFRKTGLVLGLDYLSVSAGFFFDVPEEGITVQFGSPPPRLRGFESSFIDINLSTEDGSKNVAALFDTGATQTVIRRDLFGEPSALVSDRRRVTLFHERLGGVTALVALHRNESLPDVIIGNDVMAVWGDRWYFSFDPTGGSVTVIQPKGRFNPTDGDALTTFSKTIQSVSTTP